MGKKKKKKKSLIKKVVRGFIAVVLVLLIALISIPFLFKDKVIELVSKTVNNSINATVSFKDSDLSLFKSFPLANVTVNEISIANKEPFVGDTLFMAKEVNLKLSISELFKKADEAIILKSISSVDGQLNIIVNKNAIGNYDIALKNNDTVGQTNDRPFSFNIEEYGLKNMKITYLDRASKTKMSLNNIFHTGSGDFAEEIFNLDTKTTSSVSLNIDNVDYLKDISITLDAVLELDLKNAKYSFKENKAHINQLPLEFNGFVQLVDENQLFDINFKTPTSSFKNLLALVPKQYSGNLNAVKTAGNFDLEGNVVGVLSKSTIPAFDISFSSKNAMFKYDDLPKSVEKISINSKIINETGFVNDTYIKVNTLTFAIDEDVFSANGNVANITTNPKIDIAAKGSINLENLAKVYPAVQKKELSGILKADIISKFDMNSIEKGIYENIQNTGNISVSNFKYDDDEVANPFFIDKTDVVFNTNKIQLNQFKAKTGSSDISIQGNLDNFYGFLFKNKELKGTFNLNSTKFKVDDFLSKGEDEATKNNETSSKLKIPSFLNIKLKANATTVLYDDLTLSNVSGTVLIKDETVSFQNLKTGIFDGNIGFNGNVSTKNEAAKFTMDMDMKNLNIADSFTHLEMLKSIAPIAKTIEGKINSTVKVSGNLNDDMTPNLKTISGNLLGQLLNTKLKASNSKALSLLGEKVSFLDPNKLNLNEASALLSFKNGNVVLEPFNLKYEDIDIQVAGKHSFDSSMNFDVIFDVPVKHLGSEVTNAIAKLTPKDAESVKSIPVKANLSGSFTKPNFSSDIANATSNLMKELVEKQKQSLLDKGKGKLTDLLGLGKKKKDTTKDKSKDGVKNVLDNLFKKKK